MGTHVWELGHSGKILGTEIFVERIMALSILPTGILTTNSNLN